LRGAAADADKAGQWFLQSVPGTPFSARLPQSVQPEIDHESGVTVDDWIAQRGADTFSILDYQLPAGTDTPIDPDDLKDNIKEIGQNMGTPTGEATGISLDSLKGAELTVNVTNPLMPAGTQGFLRGFASGSHIVVFLCILTGGDASEPAKEMFFGSISYRGVGTAPTQK
jgi:hypothetical protein